MQTRKPQSRPLSESEGFSHIESYLRSGLRPSEYYQQNNLSEWQFYTWRKRYLSSHPAALSSTKPEKQIHPVSITAAPDPFCSFTGLEIHYPNGVKVAVGSNCHLSVESVLQPVKMQG